MDLLDLIRLKMDTTDIEFVKEFNYLGIMFDEIVTWKPHILNVSKKIS